MAVWPGKREVIVALARGLQATVITVPMLAVVFFPMALDCCVWVKGGPNPDATMNFLFVTMAMSAVLMFVVMFSGYLLAECFDRTGPEWKYYNSNVDRLAWKDGIRLRPQGVSWRGFIVLLRSRIYVFLLVASLSLMGALGLIQSKFGEPPSWYLVASSVAVMLIHYCLTMLQSGLMSANTPSTSP